MLSIGKLTAGREDYYLDLASGHDDYYLHPDETAGRWTGTLAATLGLAGAVTPADFRAVLSGRHPTDGTPLLRDPDRPGRVTGFDLTFSAPKSASLLWALSEPAIADAVAAAHDQAVTDTVEAIEAEAVRARRGHAGAVTIAGQGVAAAVFAHRSSRAGDPQLHSHVVAANVTRGVDGAWSSLYGRPIYAWAKSAGYLYQASLRSTLTETLGVQWGPIRRGVADIAGVTPAHIEAFSARRAQITSELDRLGVHSPAAARTATLATRPAKDRTHTLADLQNDWRQRAANLQLHPTTSTPRAPREAVGVEGRLAGPEGLTANTSSFDRRAVLQELAVSHPDGATPTALRLQADRLLARPDIVALDTISAAGDRRYSTAELIATEHRVITQAETRAAERRPPVARAALDAALADRPSLSEEQKAMVEQLTQSAAGVQIVVGRAGSGKTFALDAARAAWQADGRQVIGAALAARAAAELQAGAGITSQTVDRLLADLDTPGPLGGLAPRTVIVIDEAAMIGTRKLDRLLHHAERSKAQIVLVGDHKQLPEIQAGGVFAALTRRLHPIALTTNRRQSQPWERDALNQLRSGSVARAVTAYIDQHRVTLAADADTARQALTDDWANHTARHPEQTAAMYALHRDDVDDLNRRARTHQRNQHRLHGPDIQIAGRAFAIGDQILCLRNDRRIGVRNGTTGQLADITADQATITTPDGQQISLPHNYLAAGHLTHNYATTIHKAQGATVDQAYLLGSDQLYREAGYVALSRARNQTNLYLVGPTPHATTVTRNPDPDTINQLTETLNTSRAQTLAGDQTHVPGVLEAVLAADPPAWALNSFGPPPPAHGADRDRWAADAARVATYRQNHHITNPDQPLGPRPEQPAQRNEWDLARYAIDRHQNLEHDQGLHL